MFIVDTAKGEETVCCPSSTTCRDGVVVEGDPAFGADAVISCVVHGATVGSMVGGRHGTNRAPTAKQHSRHNGTPSADATQEATAAAVCTVEEGGRVV